jgi:hypothetical protein
VSSPNDEPSVRMRCYIPVTLAAKIELLFRDPLRPGKRSYGSFSKMTTKLWTDYFAQLESSEANND